MDDGATDPGPQESRCTVPPAAPDILNFLDYRQFLKAHLDYLQSINKKFSQRWVAKRAGFKAPQLLSMIIQGQRNLARDRIEALATALKLNPMERDYLTVLVDFAECVGEPARQALLAKIQATFRSGLFATISDDGMEIFRDWYYPAVREIVTIAEAAPGPAAMAEQLGVTLSEVEDALATLVACRFLRKTGTNYERTEPSVRSNDQKIYPLVLANYHLKVLEKAFAAVRLSREQRHFEGLTFALPRTLMPRLKAEIARFVRELDMLIETSGGARDDVCQLHIMLFPLTRWDTNRSGARRG